jgi:hypothetical protein
LHDVVSPRPCRVGAGCSTGVEAGGRRIVTMGGLF